MHKNLIKWRKAAREDIEVKCQSDPYGIKDISVSYSMFFITLLVNVIALQLYKIEWNACPDLP